MKKIKPKRDKNILGHCKPAMKEKIKIIKKKEKHFRPNRKS